MQVQNEVKIGFSTNPKTRVRNIMYELQLDDPDAVFVMEGDMHHEKQLHKRFHDINLHGEWFLATSDLLSFIKEAATSYQKVNVLPTKVDVELHALGILTPTEINDLFAQLTLAETELLKSIRDLTASIASLTNSMREERKRSLLGRLESWAKKGKN